MVDLNRKSIHTFFIVIHVLVGVAGNYAPSVPGYFYLGVTFVFILDIVISKDAGCKAGFYALYVIGFEIVYRISGANIAWEAGKYFSLMIIGVGLVINQRKKIPWTFLFLLLLLLPALFLTKHTDPKEVRGMIVFNFTGPLSLVLSGMYFYKASVQKSTYINGLRFAFLPAFALIVVISLKSGLGGLQFTSVESNPDAAGGFGANQVSTALGWFLLLILLFRIRGIRISLYVWLDWIMITFLLIRGLVTLSRGGMMAAFISLFVAIMVLLMYERSFRIKTRRMMPYVIVGLFFMLGVVWYTNKLTNNFLLYRYMGVSTNELQTGIPADDKNYLTGRGDIMKGDFLAFQKYPIFGVGYGMAAKWHAVYYGRSAAAHTEYSRLLSEHGILGLIFIVIAFLGLPALFFHKLTGAVSRAFFAAFLLVSMLTMFHAAMRLAIPGILYGFSFMYSGLDRKNGLKG
jgi:hypothetical protein